MNPLWLMRMARWAKHPPPAGRVALVVGVIVLCLALVAVEKFIGWPDWLTTEGGKRPLVRP